MDALELSRFEAADVPVEPLVAVMVGRCAALLFLLTRWVVCRPEFVV